jgi:transposase-like protein
MSNRRTHSAEFKAKVAMEAISGRKTLQQIAADHAVHPIQVSQWKKQLLEGASELFSSGKKRKEKDDSQAKESELFQQIGRLKMELEWLKKISAVVMPMTYENWLNMKIANSLSAGSVSCLDCHAQHCITSQFLCVSLRSASWPGSTPSTLRIQRPEAGG